MVSLVERFTRSGGITRAEVRSEKRVQRRKGPGRSRAYVFRYAASSKAFKVQLTFRRSKVSKKELISALEEILENLGA